MALSFIAEPGVFSALEGPLVAAIMVACIMAFAWSWWQVLEDRPNPLVTWRAHIQRRRT